MFVSFSKKQVITDHDGNIELLPESPGGSEPPCCVTSRTSHCLSTGLRHFAAFGAGRVL